MLPFTLALLPSAMRLWHVQWLAKSGSFLARPHMMPTIF